MINGVINGVINDVISEISRFLRCETPSSWITAALDNQTILLIDHANCEKKAASTAINLLHRYIDRPELLNKMSRLAREELRHFEQVIALMKKRGIVYETVTASRYAAGLRSHVRHREPDKLIDVLIVGAFIEARSCERFAKLAPYLDDELKSFYLSLLKSESRHYQDYLKLAMKYADGPIGGSIGGSIEGPIDQRIAFFAEKERELIETPDNEFRFHSGAHVT